MKTGIPLRQTEDKDKSIISLDPCQPFDLDVTLQCGQVFRWEKRDGWWYGVVGPYVMKIRQEEAVLRYHGAPEQFIRDYFQLGLDLPPILASIDRDPLIHDAIHRCRGLRIIRQPGWECLASYICATFANIPGIRNRIELLARNFGDPIRFEGRMYFGFPTPESLSRVDECAVRACKVGYRAPYLCETARKINDDPLFFQRIAALPYEEARADLLSLKGVGYKVADCVLLFGFRHYESVPVDVWIQRILRNSYAGCHECRSYEQFRRFAREHFGEYAGYAQEYLFSNRKKIVQEFARRQKIF